MCYQNSFSFSWEICNANINETEICLMIRKLAIIQSEHWIYGHKFLNSMKILYGCFKIIVSSKNWAKYIWSLQYILSSDWLSFKYKGKNISQKLYGANDLCEEPLSMILLHHNNAGLITVYTDVVFTHGVPLRLFLLLFSFLFLSCF